MKTLKQKKTQTQNSPNPIKISARKTSAVSLKNTQDDELIAQSQTNTN